MSKLHDSLDEICVYCGKDKGSHFGSFTDPVCYRGNPLGRRFRGLEERRRLVAKSLNKIRDYRKEKRLCRECGNQLEESDKTRCFRCKVIHATRESILYHRYKGSVHARS